MISFTDAQIEGAMDKKMQDKHNYLTQLLSQYLTRGLISNMSGTNYFDLKNGQFNFGKDTDNYLKYDGTTFEFKGLLNVTGDSTITGNLSVNTNINGETISVSINPTVGFQIKCNDAVVGGITGDGYFIVERLQSSYNAASYATMADPGAEDFNLWSYDEESILHNFFKISHTLLTADDAILTLGDDPGYLKTITGWDDHIELYVEDTGTSDYATLTITPTSMTFAKNGVPVETW